MKQQFLDMIEAKKLYGTLLRSNDNMALYWSPITWNSPSDGMEKQLGKWLYLGTEGWYPDNTMKLAFLELKYLLGSWSPDNPGEWVDLKDVK